MPFCTIVEFEWDETFDREGFARTLGGAGGETPHPDGRLSQISGIGEKGARARATHAARAGGPRRGVLRLAGGNVGHYAESNEGIWPAWIT